MTDPKAIDPEAVEKRIVRLESLAERGWIDGDIVDLVSALSAALSEARGKVGELEALREQQAAAFVKFAKDQPVAPHPVDQMENLRRAMTTDIEIEKLEAERDAALSERNHLVAAYEAALSELAKLRETLESARDGINLIGTALMYFAGDDMQGLVTVAINTAESLRVELEAALPSPPKDPAHD